MNLADPFAPGTPEERLERIASNAKEFAKELARLREEWRELKAVIEHVKRLRAEGKC